jgi:hypothetical protein
VFADLRPATYRVTCSAAGFETVETKGVLLEVNRRAQVDFAMQVGDLKQTIEVEGSVTTVETATSAVKEVVDSKRINILPLNGRNALTLQALLPGAVQQGAGAAATGVALNTNVVFSINGARANHPIFGS